MGAGRGAESRWQWGAGSTAFVLWKGSSEMAWEPDTPYLQLAPLTGAGNGRAQGNWGLPETVMGTSHPLSSEGALEDALAEGSVGIGATGAEDGKGKGWM